MPICQTGPTAESLLALIVTLPHQRHGVDAAPGTILEELRIPPPSCPSAELQRSDAFAALAIKTCGERLYCKFMAWTDPKQKPAKLPATPAQTAGFDALLEYQDHKPFECVGEGRESL